MFFVANILLSKWKMTLFLNHLAFPLLRPLKSHLKYFAVAPALHIYRNSHPRELGNSKSTCRFPFLGIFASVGRQEPATDMKDIFPAMMV